MTVATPLTLPADLDPALSHDVGPTDVPLLDETIGTNLDRTVAAHRDHEALVEVATGRRWTYGELSRDVDVVALGLLDLGVGPGDRVGIWAPNCAEWVLVQYATARLGAILVNVNPAYRTHELAYVVRQSGMRTIVAVEEFKGSSYAAMIEEARAGEDGPDGPDCGTGLRDVVLLGTPSWERLLDVGRAALADHGSERLASIAGGLRASDPINIQYTSGTTGFPKGATLSHRNILNNGYAVGELVAYGPEDRVCIPVPFYHCFGMVMGNLACTSHGSTIVVPAPAFDPAATLAAVAQERCTSLYGVPTMFIAVLEQLDDGGAAAPDLSALRTGIMAGSPCPVETMKQVIDRLGMSEVSICYGMTETSPVSTQTRRDDSLHQRTATVGRVGPHLEIKVVDPATGATVPRGEPGELCTRGYSVMLGYWEQPEKTAEAIDDDGFMHTGDLATMDADGYVAITGRIKDLVIRGGENVYPREIEEFLLTHPDVLDVQVIGVPDARYGEELMAWVRLRRGAEPLDADGVRAYASGRLAHYKIPRYVHLVDDFPMTVTGKVRKVEMREQARDILGLG